MVAKIPGCRRISQWLTLVKDENSTFGNKLDEIFGDDDSQKTLARKMCLRTLEAFAQGFGPERTVIIARSTGRVNLVGMHIDHQGGAVNPIAIKPTVPR